MIGRSIHCHHAGKSKLRAPIGDILALRAGRYIFVAGNLYGLLSRIAPHDTPSPSFSAYDITGTRYAHCGLV